ncbi:MAG: hypothetical protein GY717_19160, partial [Rhodobacteraceae bacterium]|nr:hypothetical protein [Paracoccaceae bacterium]
RWMGEHLGVALHAGITVDQGDARGRERIVRTMARPALSLKRIHIEDDGRVRIQFKRPWRSGATGLLLRPEVFVLRLASLIMPPRVNLVRFHGVFAPASPLRSRVVPKPVNVPVEKRSRWIPWKILIKRVFDRIAGLCPVCGSPAPNEGAAMRAGSRRVQPSRRARHGVVCSALASAQISDHSGRWKQNGRSRCAPACSTAGRWAAS